MFSFTILDCTGEITLQRRRRQGTVTCDVGPYIIAGGIAELGNKNGINF